MDSSGASARRWAAGVVVAHLIISILHGAAHDGAHVPMSVPANAFVFLVVIAGPLVGLALMWRAPRAGGWIVAATMTASLVFGVVNHFVFVSPDHVAHVAREWQPLFAATAGLLALTEAVGAGIGARVARSEASSTWRG